MIELESSTFEIPAIFAILPIVIFVVMFSIIIISTIIGVIKAVKDHQNIFSKVEKHVEEKFNNVVENAEENKIEYVECKYCGMKNKKENTKCSACNAKL